jgi:hypothetical protein
VPVVASRPARPLDSAVPQPSTLPVIRVLAALLNEERIRHCQWKGAGAHARWRTGAGDIDLLVEHAHAERFRAGVARLGFKLAVPAAGPVTGIESWLAMDRASGRIVHVHVYYRLLAGTPQTTLYALPLERALLDGARTSDAFRTPPPELELIAGTLHRLLGERTMAAVLRVRRHAPAADIARLRAVTTGQAVAAALHHNLPELPYALFQQCVAALTTPSGPVRRAWLRLRVRSALRCHAVAGRGDGWHRAIARRLPGAVGAGAAAADGKRLAAGGVVIALVGGDGAGKSTCAAALRAWLAPELATFHAHLGRPPRSLATLAAGALLRLATGARGGRDAADETLAAGPAGVLRVLRDIGVARDRHRLYRRMRRHARCGAVVICERYPIAANRQLVGPRRPRRAGAGAGADGGAVPRSGVLDRLLDAEAGWYERIAAPDAVIVLRLDPELAVARKPGEPAGYVRRRAAIIRDTDWTRTGAFVIDAAQPLPQVLATLKDTVWRNL